MNEIEITFQQKIKLIKIAHEFVTLYGDSVN